MYSKFHIIFPSGDRSKLSVVEIADTMSYELNDYAVASRKSFREEDEAREYARELANQHDKEYVGGDEDDYLD